MFRAALRHPVDTFLCSGGDYVTNVNFCFRNYLVFPWNSTRLTVIDTRTLRMGATLAGTVREFIFKEIS